MSSSDLAPDFEPGDGWKTLHCKVRESSSLPGFRFLTLSGGVVTHAYLQGSLLAMSPWLRKGMPMRERQRLHFILSRTTYVGRCSFLFAPGLLDALNRRSRLSAIGHETPLGG